MAKHRLEKIPLSQLKGVSIYFEDDLYTFAAFLLRLFDAKSARDNPNMTSRPAINWVAREFAHLADSMHPDQGRVLAELTRRNIPLVATVEHDHDVTSAPARPPSHSRRRSGFRVVPGGRAD